MNRIIRNIQIAIPAHLIEKVYLSLQQSRVDEFQTISNQSRIEHADIIVRTMLRFNKDYLGIKQDRIGIS
ncbi:hypothetical protein [Streptococcus sp. SS-4456]|uniref:hypothetical protein n=1 Tax=Streptococcus sp. SS-4456 TaxID=3072286 RepID=UPI002FC5E3D6